MGISTIGETVGLDVVSVIVPVYNSASYLHRCIDSILGQNYRAIEVILVDDGSTDSSGGICDSYGRKDSRVRVMHTPNRGVSCARNAGLECSSGSFVCFVDSDDFLEDYAVKALVEGHTRSRADLVVGGFNKVKSDKTALQIRDFPLDQLLTRAELEEYTLAYLHNPRQRQLLMSSWAKLFRSSIIRDRKVTFREELRVAEDVAFNFDYLQSVESVLFIKEIIYNHQKLGTYDSLSMKLVEEQPRGLFGYIPALGSVRSFLQRSHSEAVIGRAIGQCYVYHVALFMIRACGQINRRNIFTVYRLIDELISDSDFRTHVKAYVPAEGNYKLIPFLMRMKFAWLVMGVSWYEAYKLYGTGGNIK